ncbi:hypothetical protein AgCh_017208 [Apium graveolens]
MALSKFDLSSGSPDRPLYGQRGSYSGATLDRSSSFRENMENPILSTLPSMSRSASAVNQGDVTSFLQCLRFDPKAMVADHKLNRAMDFKRLACLALGVQPDDSPFGSSKGKLASSSPEELKRFKLGLREISIKARERVKTFNEGLSVFNKCFPGIASRKRSRPDVVSGERSSGLFLNDHSATGPTVGKMGALNNTTASGFELDQQKPEERTKNAIPNKRTRTSMGDPRSDLRPNNPARTIANAEKDKEGSRLLNNGTAQGEDRTLPVGVDGWEKSKMKKKRSGIKADAAPSSSATKPIDGPGAVNGIVVVKPDGTPQSVSLGMRSSIPRSDQDSASAIHERRDRSTSSDKETVNFRALSKTNTVEELNSANPTSCSKLNAASRAPRSSSGIVSKLPPVVERETATIDWEISHCINKNSSATGTHNRRRASSARSSSPPVAQWASQRPQKMSRTARRTNFVPNVTGNDETPSLDTISDAAGNENGPVFPGNLSGNSHQQVRLKGDQYPSTALSESEESGAPEVKSREKCKNSDEVDNKSGKNVQKIATLVVPPRKNKVASGDDIRNGIRRQGGTGRGFTATRSVVPVTTEKHGSTGTAKQLRSAKLGIDKTERKSGRPPSRKLSDRKAYTRQKHHAVNAAADFLVGSGDGHEELLAAVNAVADSAYSFSSSFWRQMEQFFRAVSDVNIDYLKHQGNVDLCESKPNLVPSNNLLRYRTVLERTKNVAETKDCELSPGKGVSSDIPLCQILLSALISEDEIEEPSSSGNEGSEFNNFSYASDEFDGDIEHESFNQQSLHSFEHAGLTGFGEYGIAANGISHNEAEHDLLDKDSFSRPRMWIPSGADRSLNDFLPNQAFKSVLSCSDIQYNKMSINERALLELQSIRLLPEPVPYLARTGDEEISQEISKLEDKYHEQACRKKSFLDRLLKASMEERERQEKDFERSALEKLVAMAYQKYMSCWGPTVPGGKSASSKMAKQAALSYVKRTLEQWREYELTGKSCFSEPVFGEMFLSRSSQLSDAQQKDATRDAESGKHYGKALGCSAEGRVSGTQQTNAARNYDTYSSSVFLSGNYLSENTIGKEDTWSTRVKKRELLLDDVIGGVVGTSPGVSLGMGTSVLSSAKGKRSDRDREGKGSNRELFRNGTAKIGRSTSGNMKGERKSKLKPKQKITQLSSVNGIVGKMSEQPKTSLSSMPKPGDTIVNRNRREKDNLKLNVVDKSETIDFSSLHMDGVLDVPDDLGDQGQDIGSWLNIEDDGLQDDDFMGLEIPMDDLSELNMMV